MLPRPTHLRHGTNHCGINVPVVLAVNLRQFESAREMLVRAVASLAIDEKTEGILKRT
jgi:hypothetical protein